MKTRDLLLRYLETTSLECLNRIPKPFNNNIFWNVKHVVVTQQALVYGLSGLPMHVTTEEFESYKKGTCPEKKVTKEEVELCKKQLHALIEKTEEDWNEGIFTQYKPYTVTTKTRLTSAREAIEFNNFHEGIHLGMVLQLRKFI